MSRYDDGEWPAYVPVAERRRKAEREAARLRKTGRAVAPVRIEGRTIATTAWGRAWCDNLESYRDYESRLPRGRTYVRNGSVIDLQIGPCEVRALVSGSSIYQVAVGITAVPPARWRSIRADCAGRIDSLVELLQGRLSQGVMERMCRQGSGLFPQPSEIRFSCSCLDHASMCKHVAAVLYGVGARLDDSPELLFRLRAVDAGDLVADLDSAMPASRPTGNRVLAADDVSALFGLDLGGSGIVDSVGEDSASQAPPSRNQPTCASQPKTPTRKARAAAPAPAAVAARAAAAQPMPPESRALRPARASIAAQRPQSPKSPTGSGVSATRPAAPKRRRSIPADGANRLGKKEAEKMVADVVARIGRDLVMGMNVTTVGPGTPAGSARGARTVRGAATGSSTQAPGSGRPAHEETQGSELKSHIGKRSG